MQKKGSTQGKALAIRWLLGVSRKRPCQNMAFKLSSELVDAANAIMHSIRAHSLIKNLACLTLLAYIYFHNLTIYFLFIYFAITRDLIP